MSDTRRIAASETQAIDPITLAVVSGGLTSAVREMTLTIQRTARSPIVALGNDFSNAIYTHANGLPEMVVQGQDQPVHLGGMLRSVKSVAAKFSDSIEPGDIVVCNEPESGGTHLVDIDMIQPIFAESELIGWASTRAHMGDIGGPVPGGYNPMAEDLYGEGLVIPATKLVERGQVRDDVWDLILANVRVPELMRGDMGAQLSAVRRATRRVGQLCAKYGTDTVTSATVALLDRAERTMRMQVAAMPDGCFEGESWSEGDQRGSDDGRVRCLITIDGDEMWIEIESPPASRSYRNSYGGLTTGAIYFGVISGLEDGIPINEGLYRPVHVDLGPAGTMLNAARPAACARSTSDAWSHVFDAVCDAMSKIVPDRACAGWAHVSAISLSGVDPRSDEDYSTGSMHVSFQGGSGAVYGQDGGGLWGVVATGGAATVADVELLEFRLPLHFHRHEFLEDSACPGAWRGALGAIMDVEVVDHNAVVVHMGEGMKFPPASRLGGGSPLDSQRRVHRKFIRRLDGSRDLLPLHSISELAPGERIVAMKPGGGGVGQPVDRDPDAVAADVRRCVVSEASAREEYGVVVRPGTCEVDATATSHARTSGVFGTAPGREPAVSQKSDASLARTG